MTDKKYIIESLQEIVGADNVITEYKGLAKYAADGSFVKPFVPLCAAKPETVEEVQGIVRLANRAGIALFPYSSGTTFQGAHIPTERGISVDLSRMNKIDLLDTVARNAIIEPGVTFAQLQAAANAKGLKVMTPIGVPAAGSVLATYLECTPLYLWPRYKTWETLNIKVVLPTGEIMATGQMAMANSDRPYHWATNFAVVNRLHFCAQGTLGIAVKAAVTLTSIPAARKLLFVPLDDIAKLGEISQKLTHQEANDEYFVADSLYLACLLADSKEEIAALKKALPPFTAVVGISGNDAAEVAYKELDVSDALGPFGLKAAAEVPGVKDIGKRLMQEIDNPQGMLNQRRYKGGCTYIACMAAKTQLNAFYEIATRSASTNGSEPENLGWMIMPLNFGGSYYFEPNLYFNPDNAQDTAACRDIFMNMTRSFVQYGGYFPRPYPMWAEEVYSRIGNYHRKVKMVKQLLDPNNIMNPGKLALP